MLGGVWLVRSHKGWSKIVTAAINSQQLPTFIGCVTCGCVVEVMVTMRLICLGFRQFLDLQSAYKDCNPFTTYSTKYHGHPSKIQQFFLSADVIDVHNVILLTKNGLCPENLRTRPNLHAKLSSDIRGSNGIQM